MNTLPELRHAIDRFAPATQQALKATAHRIAQRTAQRAREILLSKTHSTGKTAASIRVLDESDRKLFLVNCPGDPSEPANLPIWLEFGTRFMTARSFMRPAQDEMSAPYVREMTATAERAAAQVFE